MTEHMKFYSFEATSPEMQRKSKEKNGVHFRRFLRYQCRKSSILLAAVGFLLGGASLTAGLFPCGIGWLAAVAVWDKRRLLLQTIPVLLGSLLWTGSPLVYTAILLLLMVFLGFYTPPRKMVRYLLPLIVFSTTLAVRGISLFFSGISDLLLINIIVESIISGGLSLVFLASLSTLQRFTLVNKPSWEEILCIFLLGTGVILGLTKIVVFSMPLSEIAMRLLILVGALLGGAGGGAAVGTLMGMIPFLSGETAVTALGVFAFSGLLGGIFYRFGRLGVIVGFFAANLVLTFYLTQSTMAIQAILASFLGALLFLCIPKQVLFCGKAMIASEERPAIKSMGSEEYVSLRLRDAGATLTRLKNAIVQSEEKQKEKNEKNIDSILAHLEGRVCGECGLKGICWDMDFHETYRDVLGMFATVESKGVLMAKELPQSFKKRCSHQKEIVASVNCLYEMYRKNEYWQQKTSQSKALLSLELENAVHLLENINENIGGFMALREVLNRKLGANLRNRGFDVDYMQPVYVDNITTELRFKARQCKGKGTCGPLISAGIYELCGRKMRLRNYDCGIAEGKPCTCRFFLEGVLELDSFSQQILKGKEGVCGDVCTDFLLPNANHCFVISDGMGSGEAAQKEAEETVNFVGDVLKSGFDQRFAAGILNYLTMNKEKKESYATADICIVDLEKRTAEFLKLGAAPSFICSPGAGVKVVAGNSLPYDGQGASQPHIFRETLSSGNIVVMVSDGVLEAEIAAKEMEYWLSKTLHESGKESAKVIGERLLSGALAFCGGSAKDDMSITVFTVK